MSDDVVKTDLKSPWLSTELPVNDPYICKYACHSYAMGGAEQTKEAEVPGNANS